MVHNTLNFFIFFFLIKSNQFLKLGLIIYYETTNGDMMKYYFYSLVVIESFSSRIIVFYPT